MEYVSHALDTQSLIYESILPLGGPVHSSVGKDEGRGDIEDLVAETAEDVEDGGVGSTGKGALTVRRESVGGDALGGRAACSRQC